MEKMIIPQCVEEILIDTSSKKNCKLLKKAGLEFEENDECELTMEFYDGYAVDVNGTGLMLCYPKLSELTPKKINAVCEYIGIWDGTISQHDVALKYGVLELSDKEEDKVIHTTLNKRYLRDETLILMSADIYQKIYDMSDDYMDYSRAARIVRILADEFEKKLDWENTKDQLDYIYEMEDFEEEALKRLEREININSKWD